ncbi:MAG TPA: glycosyltransferase family 2 protein [Deltaproteobacteria bacterium]|nr:glycosyltransferase family 2 protein [Deltaproteobacteria bacterium]
MEIFFLLSLALGLLLPYGIYFLGKVHVRGGFAGQAPSAEAATRNLSHCAPKVGVIIPLTGDTPVMKACLESLLDQSYPNYEAIFVTCNSIDPAVQIVNRVIQTKRNAQHIVSGAASRCSQKNHNLLAGVADLDPSIEILVFCDCTHWAPERFLADLVSPIVSGKAVMTTGFHRVVPGDCRLPTLGMLVSVMAIHLMQGIGFITQPWGGATAISRRIFEENGIKALWAENVVDDVSMCIHLAKAGIRVRPVSSACMLTPIGGVTFRAWYGWLKRQIFFIKVCQPATWAAGTIVAYLLCAPFLAGLACAAGIMGFAPKYMTVAGYAFLAGFLVIAMKWRTLIHEDIPMWRWIPAALAASSMTVLCYACTWFSNLLPWRGISYRVTWGGKVASVRHYPLKSTTELPAKAGKPEDLW